MELSCIDYSGGRLFFAHDFLSALSTVDQKVYLYLPNNFKNLYGSFFEHFPKIHIKTEFKNINTTALHIFFSNFKNLSNLHRIENGLVYPILYNSEINRYQKWYNQLDNKTKPMIMPVEIEQGDKLINQPNSKWAIDMLERQISNPFLKGFSFLISAGPTMEDIDPVRYLTNRSSGKMGIALARAAYIHGGNVQLILGPTHIAVPSYLSVQRIRSAADMYDAVLMQFDYCDVYIGSAAIADFAPADIMNEKIKKKDGFSGLILQPTKDILKEISKRKRKQLLVGFSVETTNAIENSKAKLIGKNLDMVVINNPKEKGAAFDAETNIVSVIFRDGSVQSWPIMFKFEVANKLMSVIKKLL
ncbi:MAG: phosphopantothenoylcysteine decarboxylase [Calditrichaceae bacterium]|nr:phosphopantothenoylcysteine decarboxylase [Calditrichaceae bacterium]